MHRFTEFYREYSVDTIRRGIREVYAHDAYFGDPFRSVRGIDAIESYFVKMAEPVEKCTFDITSSDRGKAGDYYFRWRMELRLKRSNASPIRALGISHVRFNEQGLVVFQQDYWDSSTLFDRLPVVGGMTRFVKGRLDK